MFQLWFKTVFISTLNESKIIFATFNLKCSLHAVSVRKPYARMSNFWMIRIRFGYFTSKPKPNFGYPHTLGFDNIMFTKQILLGKMIDAIGVKTVIFLHHSTITCQPCFITNKLTSGVTPIGQGWTNARGLRVLGAQAWPLYPFLCIYNNWNYSNLLHRQFFNDKVWFHFAFHHCFVFNGNFS